MWYGPGTETVNKIMGTIEFRQGIRDAVNKYRIGNNVDYYGRDLVFNSNTDLFLAIHKVELWHVKGSFNTHTRMWSLNVSMHDTYNFEPWTWSRMLKGKSLGGHIKNFIGTPLNNLGAYGLKIGAIQSFKVYINFHVDSALAPL